MRGTAALIVVLYHADALFHLGGWSPPLAFLAVDLFFCLSGFVLAKSYDGRLAGGLSPLDFMRLRIQRLFPLYLLAWALGLAASFAAGTLSPTAGTAATSGLNALMLPGIDQMFPNNPPAWSLFFELWVANSIFALFWRHLHGLRLYALVLTAFVGFIVAERHFHDFNLGFDWSTFGGGLARVMFSFFAGVWLARYQSQHPSRVRFPTIVLLAALFGVLAFSLTGQLRQIQQVVCVTIFFPMIIYLGASAKERRPEVGQLLGDASYALYVLHWPALVIATVLLGSVSADLTGLVLQLSLTLTILIAALILHLRYDMPVRHSLALRRQRTKK